MQTAASIANNREGDDLSEIAHLSGWALSSAVMLVVDNLDRSVAFYRDGLGFVVHLHEPYIAQMSLGAMRLYLVTESPPTPDKPDMTLRNLNSTGRTSVNLVFHVSDCHAVYTELSRRGVHFLTPPHSPPRGGWRCFARDPNGYLIEIEQEA